MGKLRSYKELSGMQVKCKIINIMKKFAGRFIIVTDTDLYVSKQ